MDKTKLVKVDDAAVYYDVDDELNFEQDQDFIILAGNRSFNSRGRDDLVKVVSGDYYDDDFGYDYETFEELKKLTGWDWDVTTIRGYSQGDWQNLYYVEDKVSSQRIKEIEDFCMGKVSEFKVFENPDDDDFYTVYVPDDIVWKGAGAVCDYLGFDPNTTEIEGLED